MKCSNQNGINLKHLEDGAVILVSLESKWRWYPIVHICCCYLKKKDITCKVFFVFSVNEVWVSILLCGHCSDFLIIVFLLLPGKENVPFIVSHMISGFRIQTLMSSIAWLTSLLLFSSWTQRSAHVVGMPEMYMKVEMIDIAAVYTASAVKQTQ